MRKGFIWLITATILLVSVGVGVTVALLVASSNTVVNTFTIGKVSIALEESTGEEYIMTPGVSLPKDPTVTVVAKSEDCWLFVRIEKENGFDAFCEYEIASGWSALDGYDGVYCRMVKNALSDQAFSVLNNDSIYVKDSVTEEQLSAVTENPKLNVTAYAVQNDSGLSAKDAWTALNLTERSE